MSRSIIKRRILRNPIILGLRHGVQLLTKNSGRSTHYAKKELIVAFKTAMCIGTLVETGTYLGEMVQSCLPYFNAIISIEINPLLAKEASAHFKKNNNVSIINGDSGLALKEILKTAESAILFWLDAHYSAGITGRSHVFGETPISEELQVIFSNWTIGSVILIDDADLFNGSEGYPQIKEIEAYVSNQNKGLRFMVNRNIICIF